MKIELEDGLIRVRLGKGDGDTIGEFVPLGDPQIHLGYIRRMIRLCCAEAVECDADRFVMEMAAELKAKAEP